MTKSLLSITALTITSASNIYAQANAPIQASFLHQLRNSDDGSGSVSVDRWDIRGGVPLMQKDGSLLAIGFRYALDRYDFNNSTANWKAVHHANLGLAARWKINDKWLWANYATAGIAAEESADKSDAFVFNYITIAEYKVSDKLNIGPGFGTASEVNGDISIFPILAVKWQINDEWKFASGPSAVAPAGANVYFQYTPKSLLNKWIFDFGFSFSSKDFKLASNPTTTNGSGEERLASAYLAASYKLENGVKISTIAGYHLYQSYSIFDNAGNELSKENFDDAPYFGVSVGYDF